MKPKILFEGTVIDSWKSNSTDPSSEVIDLNYTVQPFGVYDIVYNEQTREAEKTLAYVDDKGWTQITLPTYHGLKAGDKIQVIKV
jgi:hypothetical protein